MQYAKHNFREDVVAFNGKEVLQAGGEDINITHEEDFNGWCKRAGFESCTREEFTAIYLKSSEAINQFIKNA